MACELEIPDHRNVLSPGEDETEYLSLKSLHCGTNQMFNISQAALDLIRSQFQRHGSLVVNSMQSLKDFMKIDLPFSHRKMEIIIWRSTSMVIMQVDVFNPVRTLFQKTKTGIFL